MAISPCRSPFSGLTFAALGFVTDGCYALLAGAVGGWLKRGQAYRHFERYVSGALLVGLGLTAQDARGRSAGIERTSENSLARGGRNGGSPPPARRSDIR